MQVAVLLRDVRHSTLHQAALFAILSVLESFEVSAGQASRLSLPSSGGSGVLGSLLSISAGPDSSSSVSSSSSFSDGPMLETIVAIVDWALRALSAEADPASRAMITQVAQTGLRIIEQFQGGV